MYLHPDLMFSLARDRQRDLIAEAGKRRLFFATRRAWRVVKCG